MSKKPRLLIVDDEPHILRVLQAAFDKEGFETRIAEDASSALAAFEDSVPDCVLTDVTMPGMSGYELLREVQERFASVPVVIMTAYGTIPAAVQAIRDGAFEYVTKPFDLDSVKQIVRSALSSQSAAKPPKPKSSKKPGFTLIAESAAMKEIAETIRQVADSRATVLITGESGVGKEVVAKAIHQSSSRSANPFVAVSCAALPESLLESELFGYEKGAFTGASGAKPGRFELAHTGTLFLDEIGDVPLSIQVKLLRVLQERQIERLGSSKASNVDIRLITATNRDLRDAVERGDFRLDLLFRLQVVELLIPPLRERNDDVLPLARSFLEKFCPENGRKVLRIPTETARALESYSWPGNVRELENAMERASVLAPKDASELSVAHLPPALRSAA